MIQSAITVLIFTLVFYSIQRFRSGQRRLRSKGRETSVFLSSCGEEIGSNHRKADSQQAGEVLEEEGSHWDWRGGGSWAMLSS